MSPRLALAALLAGHALSRTGNTVAAFAVPFLVLSRGGSALDVGVAAFAATIPVVVGGPLGGGSSWTDSERCGRACSPTSSAGRRSC